MSEMLEMLGIYVCGFLNDMRFIFCYFADPAYQN